MADRPSKPLRLCVLTPDFPPARGGIQHLVHRLTQHLEGVELIVVTLGQAKAAEFDRAQAFEIVRVRGARRRSLAIGRLNARALRAAMRFRPDVILSAHIVTSPAAALVKRILGVPVVQYLYASEVATRPRLAAFALRSATVSIAISRHTEQLALAVGASADRLRLITPGVDLPADSTAGRAARPTVVTVAQLESRYKGFDVMVRALPLVRAQVPEVEWVIVGDGPLRGEIEHLVLAHRLDGAARFIGEVGDDERDLWLQKANVFAMPSRLGPGRVGGEGFGIAYLEASARGLPVVAGNVGGALDAVIDQRTGLLVDPTDHVAVANAITELLRDPARAAALGRAGKEHALQFAWPRIVKQVEQLLVEVARPRARP